MSVKTWVAVSLLLAATAWSKDNRLPEAQAGSGSGILQSVENGSLRTAGQDLRIERSRDSSPVVLSFRECQGIGVQREADQWWVLPTDLSHTPVHANSGFWILPRDPFSPEHAWHLEWKSGDATAVQSGAGLLVSFDTPAVTLARFESRPHSDPLGHRFSFQIGGNRELESTLAAFYWGTMLPSVVEKTMAADFPYSSGYVLSTLNVKSYAGSYPAVDHEFQIKGRLAMCTAVDLDIVRRMIALQFKLMQDDPERLSRIPTSVQPNGTREYHIRRDSKDARENAAMFPLTANIEVVEESWQYYAARKDLHWLRENIDNLEHAAGWTLASTDPYGRVWSDVYYEDQVIKDGRETEAQAFAAHSFDLLARMERLLGRETRSSFYERTSKKLALALVSPLPFGYWDEQHGTFVDWVDRNSKVHGHIPLLANILPVTLGYATPAQVAAVQNLIRMNGAEFERFPSFVAADIAGYTSSEMGTAGPYDLSAAGRYWYWDAAFRTAQSQNDLLAHQLDMVAAEGKTSAYFMGERYDMDHVYYVDGKNAHGAEKYYEYPNVFAAVVISDLLGLTLPADADVAVAPHLASPGEVRFDTPAYALQYTWDGTRFTLKNLSPQRRRFKVDLSGIGLQGAPAEMGGTRSSYTRSTFTLAPQGEAHWTLPHPLATP